MLSRAGLPPPQVKWWEGRSLLDGISEVNASLVTSNSVTLAPLTRRDLHRALTCQASNSDLTAPLSRTITLDMNCEC